MLHGLLDLLVQMAQLLLLQLFILQELVVVVHNFIHSSRSSQLGLG